MYFLNGERIYIKPKNGCASTDDQILSCFEQLQQINSGKQIFKLNFFADTPSEESYRQLRDQLKELVAKRFGTPVICGLIAQPPLTCRILVEAFYFDPSLWNPEFIFAESGSAALLQREGTKVLVGHSHAAAHSCCRENADAAFSTFESLLKQAGLSFGSVIRQWNYIENITGFDGGKQRYQVFNNVRTDFYGHHFKQNGFPAATGIGMNQGGVIIEFVAVESIEAVSLPLDNPEQVAAHDYSQKVLVGKSEEVESTPKFERARYLEIFGKKQVFISGTASIRGEKTVGINDPVKQTEITIQNLQRLYSREVLSTVTGNSLQPVYGHARVYVKNKKDFPAIKRTFKRYYGNLPVVYIIADICRDDLLVEIEGKVILK
jgi:enamine deaminase RidA (YjgF/YER057c/UK114 family)